MTILKLSREKEMKTEIKKGFPIHYTTIKIMYVDHNFLHKMTKGLRKLRRHLPLNKEEP